MTAITFLIQWDTTLAMTKLRRLRCFSSVSYNSKRATAKNRKAVDVFRNELVLLDFSFCICSRLNYKYAADPERGSLEVERSTAKVWYSL